jgi:uncharacterized protein YjgD (DUF1641 family)
MAKPIEFYVPEKAAMPHSEELRKAPVEHAEALLSTFELLQLLHDRGILSLLRGLVAGGDEVISTVTAAVDTQESIRGLRNFLLLTKFFANIPPEVLNRLIETVNAVARRGKSPKAPGMLSLLLRLRSEDSRHAASVGVDLLEGLGKGL